MYDKWSSRPGAEMVTERLGLHVVRTAAPLRGCNSSSKCDILYQNHFGRGAVLAAMTKATRPDIFRFAPERVDGQWRVIDTETGEVLAHCDSEQEALETAVTLIQTASARSLGNLPL